jgi:hypothetical protein
MASHLSIGIELQPEGVDHRWCGCSCSIALAPPQHVAGWCAARPCGGRGSCRWLPVRGRCGGCERPLRESPPGIPGLGPWGSGPGLCGSCGRWLGAGLASGDRRSPERVWTLGSVTLLVLPLESLPTALTVKGAGGEKQPGRTPTLVLTLSGWLLFRKAARALCGLLIHEPPRSSWTTRPQPQVRRSWSWSSWSVMKNNLRRLRRPPATTNSPQSNSQGLKNSQSA